MADIPRGIRKASEYIVQKGRSLVFTEEDADRLSWSAIPDGALKINPKTGIMSVKLEGETDWVPAGIKNDGTIALARDSIIREETFTVVDPDEGDGCFSYKNSLGQVRHMPLTAECFPVFELEEGEYCPGRNVLEVWINDVLRRNNKTGGITELTPKRFAMQEKLCAGQEITVRYHAVIRIGNPYPRIFIGDKAPDPADAEIGDLHIDTDYNTLTGSAGTYDYDYVSWSAIKGTPDTLAGYGILDAVTYKGHKHDYSEITNTPAALPASGGHASSADTLAVTRRIMLQGDVEGSCWFDGSGNSVIDTAMSRDVIRNEIKDITGTDNVPQYISDYTSRVAVITGEMVPSVDAVIPIPEGFSRDECAFFVTVKETRTETLAFHLDVDLAAGKVSSFNNVKKFSYMTVGKKAGGR